MFSYNTTRHRIVESSRWSPSRWSSIFFLMIRMFWASIACSIVMSFNYYSKNNLFWFSRLTINDSRSRDGGGVAIVGDDVKVRDNKV